MLNAWQMYAALGLLAALSISTIYSATGRVDSVVPDTENQWREFSGPHCTDSSTTACKVRGRMATKTDYDESLSDLKSGIDAASAAGCKPIQLQLISRHGARFPTVKDWTTRMGPLLHKLKDHPLYEDHPLEYTTDQLETLSSRGHSQLVALGRRMAAVFPELMDHWSNDTMRLESSFKTRSETSAQSWLRGAFDGETLTPYKRELTQTHSDKYMRAFEACAQHVEQKDGKAAAQAEIGQNPKLWKAGERVGRVREQVMERLGWKTMSTSDLLTLYKTCGYLMLTESRFERGQPREPALCGVFSGTDLGALEYYFDLKKYYGFGYGLPVNSQLARPLLQLIQEEWAQQQHKGSYRFGHAETTLPVMTALGLFKDKFQLRHDTDAALIESRQWNMSHVSPMASNILFVLHDCEGTNKIQLYVNEQLTSMSEVCTQIPADRADAAASLCTVASFAKKFPEYQNRDWDRDCKV